MTTPRSAVFVEMEKGSESQYFFVDPNHALTEDEAKRAGYDRYYYPAYDAKAEWADDWVSEGKHYRGWLVTVLH